MLRIHTLEHASDLARIRPLWEELFAQKDYTLFQSHAWNETAGRVFEAREPLRLVVAENSSGAAIVPACVREGAMGLIGEKLFDYRDVLSSEPLLIGFAWEKLAGLQMDFEVTAVRAPSAAAWHLLRPQPFANAPAVLRKHRSSEAFLGEHNRLGRHSRRIRKHGVELHRYNGSERRLVRRIYERKGAQGDPAQNLFSDPLRRSFMEEICAHPEVECEIFTYESSGEVVAALVTFRDGSWRRFYTVYYDQRWASLSPGQVLLFEITAESLAQGLDCDYMTGEYPYKMRLATTNTPLFQIRANRDRMRDAATSAISSAPLAA